MKSQQTRGSPDQTDGNRDIGRPLPHGGWHSRPSGTVRCQLGRNELVDTEMVFEGRRDGASTTLDTAASTGRTSLKGVTRSAVVPEDTAAAPAVYPTVEGRKTSTHSTVQRYKNNGQHRPEATCERQSRPTEPTIRDEETGERTPNLQLAVTAHLRQLYETPQPNEIPRGKYAERMSTGRLVASKHALPVLWMTYQQESSSIWAQIRENRWREFSVAFLLAGDDIPSEWLESKVALIHKRGGDPGLLRDDRPVTVTCVLYRVFAQILKAWMGAWAEVNNHLTELQNGFHQDRRLEDNMFTLSLEYRECQKRVPPSSVLLPRHTSGLTLPGGHVIQQATQCRHLGVNLCAQLEYTLAHEDHLYKASRRADNVLRR
ncbi:hypothetical protein HPB49_005508 [Dermacentor silvarum]|uniref:Uncharacterized protein n=1 Tax=Dermacentor silvarum TaxID=543639 RepID=A0ACB8DI38_DERSI|nr:hypothetical protein HPB49_005508 [Dermacentor silvarum]